MARLPVAPWLLIAVVGLSAAASCELVMDELPSARTPSTGLDASADKMESGADHETGEDASEDWPGDAPDLPLVPDSHEEPSTCPCDCDSDGHLNGGCDGDDCDDDDGEVFTGQQQYFEVESRHRQYDYDCNSQFDPDPKWNVVVNCTGLSLLLCDDTVQGYLQAVPACGQPGVWAKCFKAGAFCDSQVLYESKKLPCK